VPAHSDADWYYSEDLHVYVSIYSSIHISTTHLHIRYSGSDLPPVLGSLDPERREDFTPGVEGSPERSSKNKCSSPVGSPMRSGNGGLNGYALVTAVDKAQSRVQELEDRQEEVALIIRDDLSSFFALYCIASHRITFRIA
jgi:hypothetical protein